MRAWVCVCVHVVDTCNYYVSVVCGHSCRCVYVCVYGMFAKGYMRIRMCMFMCTCTHVCVRSQPVCMILISTYVILHNVPVNIF